MSCVLFITMYVYYIFFFFAMFGWIIQVSIISILFICLVHHILVFFTSTLTVPKIKDLVNSPMQKYQHIFDTFKHNDSKHKNAKNENSNTYSSSDYTEIDLLPRASNDDDNDDDNNNTMKDELKMFLKKQLTSF